MYSIGGVFGVEQVARIRLGTPSALTVASRKLQLPGVGLYASDRCTALQHEIETRSNQNRTLGGGHRERTEKEGQPKTASLGKMGDTPNLESREGD